MRIFFMSVYFRLCLLLKYQPNHKGSFLVRRNKPSRGVNNCYLLGKCHVPGSLKITVHRVVLTDQHNSSLTATVYQERLLMAQIAILSITSLVYLLHWKYPFRWPTADHGPVLSTNSCCVENQSMIIHWFPTTTPIYMIVHWFPTTTPILVVGLLL
jgi:hypothetical protein